MATAVRDLDTRQQLARQQATAAHEAQEQLQIRERQVTQLQQAAAEAAEAVRRTQQQLAQREHEVSCRLAWGVHQPPQASPHHLQNPTYTTFEQGLL